MTSPASQPAAPAVGPTTRKLAVAGAAAAPAAPTAPTAPCSPRSPAGPAGPCSPGGPATPCGPRSPAGPAAPRSPGVPAIPRSPCDPGGPAGPGGPGGPAGPAGPRSPASPATPASPCGPGGPGGPAGPAGPRSPCAPAGPAGPAAPVDPCDPCGPCCPSHAASISTDAMAQTAIAGRMVSSRLCGASLCAKRAMRQARNDDGPHGFARERQRDHRRADRRRRVRRPVAGHRAAPGARPIVLRHGRRSGAGRRQGRARVGDRGGGAAPVRNHRRVGRRRRTEPADPRHGDTDSRLGDAARPVFLTFDGEITPGEPFAHMIENRDLVTALVAKARDEGVILRPTAVTACETQRDQAATRLADGATVAARLVVAADGARSRLRELAGIETFGWSYDQAAIVTTVAH